MPRFSQNPRPDKPPDPPEGQEAKNAIRSVVFQKQAKPDGSFVYRSNAPGRKMIILQQKSPFEPAEGVAYDIAILHDSNPSDLGKGTYTVRIIAETEAPMAKKRERKGHPLPIEINEEKETVLILETELPLNKNNGPLVPRPEAFRYFTLDEDTLEIIEKAATAVELNEPCLLEGETSTTKTSGIEFLAMATGNEKVRLNLNGQTDTTELIGKFVPSDGSLQIQFEQMLKHTELLQEKSVETFKRANGEGRGLSLIESQKIAQQEGLKIPDWRWQDGLDIQAKKNGWWLILDEINLAEPQILERLNSQLEKNPSLTVSENNGVVIRKLNEEEMELYQQGELPGVEPLHPNFRIFATMNPAEYTGRHPFSPAYKNRWPSYKFVHPPTENSYLAMLTFMIYGEPPEVMIRGQKYQQDAVEPLFPEFSQLPNFRGFLTKLAKFHVLIEDFARRRKIGKNKKEKYIFTRRDLIEFMHYLGKKSLVDRKTGERLTLLDVPENIVTRAIRYYYLDKISDKDDLKKVTDQLGLIGISEERWTHQFSAPKKAGGRTPPPNKPGGAPDATGGKPETKGKEGRDPETFLKEAIEVLGTSYKDAEKTWLPTISADGTLVHMHHGTASFPPAYIDGTLTPKEFSLPDMGSGNSMNLGHLLKELKGKRVRSLSIAGIWYLQIIEASPAGAPKKEFIGLAGPPIKINSEKSFGGYTVGDMLTIKALYPTPLIPEIIDAKKLQVVGFTDTIY